MEPNTLKITKHRYAELPAQKLAELKQLASNEFDQFAIVRETHWATPDWSYLGSDGRKLACYYNLLEREVRFDDQPVKIVGLNNLITAPAYKRRGLASQLLTNTQGEWFSSTGANYALLLCASALLPFYQRLGWQRVSSEVRFTQPERACVWSAECMVLSPKQISIAPTVIDLCGQPW